MLISQDHYASYLAPPFEWSLYIHLDGLLSPFSWISSISFLLFPSFVHLSFHSWVSFYYSLIFIYFRINKNRAKRKHSERNAVGTNLTCKLSSVCKIPWRNYTARQSRRKDIMKNVIKQVMKLSSSHFTSFSLWFDYYCVRIFLWCYSLFSPILEMSKH